MVHEFIVDTWPSLQQKLDPSRGNIDSLTFVAFLRFARRRALQEQRLRSALVDPRTLDSLSVGSERTPTAERESVLRAFNRLSADERLILGSYFGRPPMSERELATARGVSRFQIRSMLVNAIAHLASTLTRPEGISPADWEVVEAIWVTGLTESETATALNLTSVQVKSAVQRVTSYFTSHLRGS
jgi:DNA-directed RNA polymerase specialized sigma24 family protein